MSAYTDEKGAFGGTCNRSACSGGPATWHNPNTLKFYCQDCAVRINQYIPFDQRQFRCVRRAPAPDDALAAAVESGELPVVEELHFCRELEESEFRPGLLRDFMLRACGVDLDQAYVSELSELADFWGSRGELLKRVKDEYGRDLSHLPGGMLLVDALRALETQ